MASLSSAGIGSGLDINGIISQLMVIERQPLMALQQRQSGYESKISAFGAIQSALASLQDAAGALAAAGTFTGKLASGFDATILSATASATTPANNYSVNISQIATHHTLLSTAGYATPDDTLPAGTLSITAGGITTDIVIDASNNTLTGLRTAINDANAGVTASIVNDGSAYRLVLAAQTSGSVGAITVAGMAFDEAQPAADAQLTINGVPITSSSNTLANVIDGLTLRLVKPGSTSITVGQDHSATQAAIQSFVDAYNKVMDEIGKQTAYDPATRKAATLTGDATVRSIQTRLKDLVHAAVSGIAGGITRLSDIGITVQKDGTLAISQTKLDAALADPAQDVAALFAQTTVGNEGVAVRFKAALGELLGSTGLIEQRTSGIQGLITSLNRRMDSLEYRLIQIEKRYRDQFTALDALVSSMNQTSTFLTQQLANLPKITSGNNN